MAAEQVSKIQQDVARVLAIPDVRTRLTELGVDIVASTPQEFGTYVRSEMTRYARIIKDASIKPE
jgi:tripartite-type tricarboxylate transporter receptor subunit TctC